LTSEKHKDHISNGQRVSQLSLPTLLYFLFSPPHIFLNSNKRIDSCAPLKDKLNKRVILGQPANGTNQPIGKNQRAVSTHDYYRDTDRKFGQQNNFFEYFDQV